MRILIVSYESWRETNNGGNVLSNIFESFSDAEFAQVYCSGELPQNSLCKKYYQISDLMLLNKTKGIRLEERDYSIERITSEIVPENNIKNRIPNLFRNASLLAREVLWQIFNWKTSDLVAFVKDFNPDIIFAPCYSYFHVSQLALYIKHVANCPMISYISDDNYSLNQFNYWPSFIINRLITRKWIRRLFSESSLIYTMTELQKKEYENIFHRPMKILCKSADFRMRNKEIEYPIQFVYAGGLYLNRWKVLAKLAESIKKINDNQVKAQLHIYSSSLLNKRQMLYLNDGNNIVFHSLISYYELMEQYRKSDVAVLVESFDRKNRLITRLSFSTKIIDCLNSGCAIMAIGPASQAGIAYLRENNSAICVDNIKKINSAINTIIENNSVISDYAHKAYILGAKNHNKCVIQEGIKKDFINVLNSVGDY